MNKLLQINDLDEVVPPQSYPQGRGAWQCGRAAADLTVIGAANHPRHDGGSASRKKRPGRSPHPRYRRPGRRLEALSAGYPAGSCSSRALLAPAVEGPSRKSVTAQTGRAFMRRAPPTRRLGVLNRTPSDLLYASVPRDFRRRRNGMGSNVVPSRDILRWNCRAFRPSDPHPYCR
jgi:hypothetical protein